MDDRASYVNGTAGLESSETSEADAVDGDRAGMALRAEARPSLTPTFLAELAAAMRSAAERERERIAIVMSEDAAVHVEKVRGRAGIETEELRRMAEDDIRAVEEWSVAEIDRVRNETTQRIEDRRSSLEDYLRQHETIIEAEIEGVDAAVRGFGETLDRFFEGLAASGDPSEIVRRAETLPAPPDLDRVRSAARASAVSMFADAPASDATAASPGSIEARGNDVSDADASGDSASMDSGSAGAFTGSEAPVEATGEIDGTREVEATGETDGTGPVEATGGAEVTQEATSGAEVTQEMEATGEAEVTQEVAALDEGHVEPVGVMDPAIGVGASWPAADESVAEEPVAAEPVVAAPAVDHTSAAVRLLRSVAPWTAPTHAIQPEPASRQD